MLKVLLVFLEKEADSRLYSQKEKLVNIKSNNKKIIIIILSKSETFILLMDSLVNPYFPLLHNILSNVCTIYLLIYIYIIYFFFVEVGNTFSVRKKNYVFMIAYLILKVNPTYSMC